MKTKKAKARSRRISSAEQDRRDSREIARSMKLINSGKVSVYRYHNAMDIFR
jgi:hypothetical protein